MTDAIREFELPIPQLKQGDVAAKDHGYVGFVNDCANGFMNDTVLMVLSTSSLEESQETNSEMTVEIGTFWNVTER